jgi:hypothetical protein
MPENTNRSFGDDCGGPAKVYVYYCGLPCAVNLPPMLH